MLFTLFGKKERPREFVYTPRYYDPEKDKDRTERMRFDQGMWERKRSRVSRGMHPLVLLLFALVVAALIYTLHTGHKASFKVTDISLSPADVPAQTAPADSVYGTTEGAR